MIVATVAPTTALVAVRITVLAQVVGIGRASMAPQEMLSTRRFRNRKVTFIVTFVLVNQWFRVHTEQRF